MGTTGSVFPLVPRRRRVAGAGWGNVASRRRGHGVDLAGTRPYRPGDDVRLIDRRASARLSTTMGSDELVVREHLTEESTRVVLIYDRSPSMRLGDDWPDTPWLSKREAVDTIRRVAERSAAAAHSRFEVSGAAEGVTAETALVELVARDRPPPSGSFVFLVSDFLHVLSDDAWSGALGKRWDVVPVIVQDPVWEQSFPDLPGVLVPFADAGSGRVVTARLSRREVDERRRGNEARLAGIRSGLERFGLDWVLVSSSNPDEVIEAFSGWAAARLNGGSLR
jgi:uncharacterized protein (DUF58 family)